jgi:hypothetical protein
MAARQGDRKRRSLSHGRAGRNKRRFLVRPSGNVGQEILDPDGKTVSWTTDEWTAQVICKLLNENEQLVYRPTIA